MGRYATLATCQLDQWALDFKGNMQRIMESIRIAKARGAKYRLGPELEVCGYSCEDHFFEDDTIQHSWEVIEEILKTDLTDNILCDIGMPIMHDNVRYNCRIFLLNRHVLMIRPKMHLADEGAYREGRWFTGWARGFLLQDFQLPRPIRELTGDSVCKFGVGALQLADTSLGSETCEELFTPNNPGIALGLGGVEILANGSGSCHTLGKLCRRVDLITEQTKKNGGVYLYANQQGCDGGRLYFDGSAMVVLNGSLVAQGSQFSLRDVEVTVATIDLTDVQGYRASIASRGVQASTSPVIPKIRVDFYMCEQKDMVPTTDAVKPRFLSEEEEVAYGPACWLWDTLRRSRTNGFALPLSGGADSACVAAIVGIMTQLVWDYLQSGEDRYGDTLNTLRAIVQDPNYIPTSAKDICSRILFCCHHAWEGSQPGAMDRAKALAAEIGANFTVYNIDAMLNAALQHAPKVNGAELEGELVTAKENLVGRVRMSMTYYHGQIMLPQVRPNVRPGTLLILSSTNADAALRGYFTKYDCSSGDLNPIGALSKSMLRRFIVWAADRKDMPTLHVIAAQRNHTCLERGHHSGHVVQAIQPDPLISDTMTHEEVSEFGKLRKDDRCGPVMLFHKMLKRASDTLSPASVAMQVKRFFVHYAAHRHKMTTLTPSYFLESHASDDNRYDPRQFIYDSSWAWQFHRIDRMVAKDEEAALMGRKRPRDVAATEVQQVQGWSSEDQRSSVARRRFESTGRQ